MSVEVVYAGTEIFSKTIQLAKNSTIEDAINQSGVLEQCAEIDLTVNKIGVYSQQKRLDDSIEDGERIEIYRPLTIDPMEARRKRANK